MTEGAFLTSVGRKWTIRGRGVLSSCFNVLSASSGAAPVPSRGFGDRGDHHKQEEDTRIRIRSSKELETVRSEVELVDGTR